jgi:hypothetical protein
MEREREKERKKERKTQPPFGPSGIRAAIYASQQLTLSIVPYL